MHASFNGFLVFLALFQACSFGTMEMLFCWNRVELEPMFRLLEVVEKAPSLDTRPMCKILWGRYRWCNQAKCYGS